MINNNFRWTKKVKINIFSSDGLNLIRILLHSHLVGYELKIANSTDKKGRHIKSEAVYRLTPILQFCITCILADKSAKKLVGGL